MEADEIQKIGQPNRWLSTKIINAATELIRKKFPEVGGLFNCQWGSMLQFNPAKSNKWVQIIHNNRDHYVAACKGFGSDHVLVFDSNWNGGEPDQHLIYCIAKIENTKEKILNIGLMDCEKQKEYGSCGLYAIAFATALVHSMNPSELRFDVSKFRPHLICRRNNSFSNNRVEGSVKLETKEENPNTHLLRLSDARLWRP